MKSFSSTALAGLRILDFSQGAAGPWATQLLGDFGADVIKVEPPKGDWCRQLGPPFVYSESPLFLALNRNKRSIVLDLKQKEERRLARAIAARVDVVLESFRPGVMETFGLGYETLRAANPMLIYCSISGFGDSGPWRDRPAVDGVIQALGGLMSTTGNESGEPVKTGIVADIFGGTMASHAVLLALVARMHHGCGQKVDVPLLDCLLALQTTSLTTYLNSGEAPSRLGSHAPYAAPNGAFPTSDGYIYIAANLDSNWSALCAMLDRPGLTRDERFVTNADRVQHRSELVELLSTLTIEHSTNRWAALLTTAGIPHAPITSYAELVETEQLAVSNMLLTLSHAHAGTVRTINNPARLKVTPSDVRRAPPLLGEHRSEILAAFGLRADETDGFRLEKTAPTDGAPLPTDGNS